MTTITALADSVSTVDGWKAAASHLHKQPGRCCNNLIYAIQKPTFLSLEDVAIIQMVDDFAIDNDLNSTTTVANTIFPLDTFLKYGADNFCQQYLLNVFPRVTTSWGNYFERMIRRRDLAGKDLLDSRGLAINPLLSLSKKLAARRATARGTMTHYEMMVDDEAYELSTYLPEKDRNYQRGGPCLSHLSFKINKSDELALTAVYRSHFYVERALGNLVGLARLQAFVAQQAGATPGALTIHAVSAVLETNAKKASRRKIDDLLADCGIK